MQQPARSAPKNCPCPLPAQTAGWGQCCTQPRFGHTDPSFAPGGTRWRCARVRALVRPSATHGRARLLHATRHTTWGCTRSRSLTSHRTGRSPTRSLSACRLATPHSHVRPLSVLQVCAFSGASIAKSRIFSEPGPASERARAGAFKARHQQLCKHSRTLMSRVEHTHQCTGCRRPQSWHGPRAQQLGRRRALAAGRHS
jgi:hypothetical protein